MLTDKKEKIKSTLETIIKELKENNSYAYLSEPIEDTEYIIGLTRRTGEACLYADHGGTTLACVYDYDWFSSPEGRNRLVDKLAKTITDKENGIVECSDCEKKIKINEIAGRYFAGIYCKDCWENKWQAIEAKETYE